MGRWGDVWVQRSSLLRARDQFMAAEAELRLAMASVLSALKHGASRVAFTTWADVANALGAHQVLLRRRLSWQHQHAQSDKCMVRHAW